MGKKAVRVATSKVKLSKDKVGKKGVRTVTTKIDLNKLFNPDKMNKSKGK